MVLEDLGSKITSALRRMANNTLIDGQVVDEMLKEIGNALVAADVNIKLVISLRAQIKKRINLDEMPAGVNKRKMIQKAVFDELVALLECDADKAYTPVKGKPNVLMMVGLQGAGKTTTVAKLAYYYKKKGWRCGMVCADTFRAGAFDQLKQNATRSKIPFYGSYTEADPVKVARDGVEQFKKDNYEIIIVDTSGRHKQEDALFEEMKQIQEAVTPNNIIFVMDSSIGQAAADQATAFKSSVDVGACIITKLDGHARGGGALSAVSTTRSPIVFTGTGEHIEELEPFVARRFVSKLLDLGSPDDFLEKIKAVLPSDKDADKAMTDRIRAGVFSMRDMYEQFQNILKLGPLSKVMEMIPGYSGIMKAMSGGGGAGGADQGSRQIKVYMTIMDSMTDEELDASECLLTVKGGRDSRIRRIARGSGHAPGQVMVLLEQYKTFKKMMSKFKNIKVDSKGQIQQRNMNQVAQMMPQQLMQQMGGAGAMSTWLKQMNNMGGPGGGGGGGGGAGGMPDMSALADLMKNMPKQ